MAALVQFRPTIWSSNLIIDIDETLVAASVSNTDYQGEITGKGNVVKINEIGDISLGDYTEDTDITVSPLTGAQKELVIDQAKYFAFNVDDVLAAQSNVAVMSGAMAKAGQAIASAVDTHIFSKYAEAGLTVANLGTSTTDLDVYATHLTAGNSLLGVLTLMNRYANEGNLPEQGRFFVVNPTLASYFSFAGLVDHLATGGTKWGDPVSKGRGFVGHVQGWDVYSSNNLSNDATEWRCLFGTKDAISFAGQVVKMETGRVEKQFGDFVKGLYVYGAKVVRPDHLGCAYLAPTGLST